MLNSIIGHTCFYRKEKKKEKFVLTAYFYFVIFVNVCNGEVVLLFLFYSIFKNIVNTKEVVVEQNVLSAETGFLSVGELRVSPNEQVLLKVNLIVKSR